MRRVTFSRNVTLSLSRTCRCHCKYCSFATHKPHLHEPEEVERLIDRAARRGVKELLVLTGEAPAVQDRLEALGFEDFVAYVMWACEKALERGLLPHTNLGVLPATDLARLREVTASQGLMLESTNPDLVAHQGSPTKHPEIRLQTIRAAGELKIPFTSGILVGIGESEEDRMASLEALAGLDHIQEIILQNFVPHRRYYGEEPAEIATEAAERYWATGISDAPHRDAPAWACPVTVEDMVRLVKETRRLMPEIGIQVPPNLADWWPELVQAGATDLGGLSSNGDHISPEHPFPSPEAGARAPRRDRRAERAPVRLPAVHGRGVGGAARARGDRAPLRLLHAASHAARRASRTRSSAPATGERLHREELEAMFAESRPEVIEDMRQAADELRAELAGDLVTFVVNRNINVSNICTVGCAFCGFGVGKRSPDAYEHSQADFVRRIHDAVAFGATEICMQSGIHPDWGLEEYLSGCARQGDGAAAAPARLQPDGGRAHVRRLRALAARRLRAAPRGRARLAFRAPPPRSCTTASASASAPTSCRSRAGWRSSPPRTRSGCARR